MGLNFHLFRGVNTDIHISCTFNVIYTLDYDKGVVERTEIRTLQVYSTFDKLTYNPGFSLQKHISTMAL